VSAQALFEMPEFRRVSGPALRPGGTALTAMALEQCVLPPGALVADVGCGRGASLSVIAERGFTAVGVDPSDELLAEAAESLPGARLARAVAEDLPLRSDTFSAVFCECVLSVTRDPARALAEMRRILVPGGLLIASDLYLRDPLDPDTELPAGCAAGAVPRSMVESRFAAAGFTIRIFVDHSRLLAELAASLLFAGFSLESLGVCGSGRGRPGYYLCIAQ